MTETLDLAVADILPERKAVLEHQGIPSEVRVSERIAALYEAAEELLLETAEPRAVLSEISTTDFATVYRGEGRNEPKTPVGDIFDLADYLALFALTLGGRTSQEITRRFDADDLALASMLDSVASMAAERTADIVERHYVQHLQGRGWPTAAHAALRYSPGYCGWHVSGQKRLFAYLCPETIGLTLRTSFLMEPLKSVSGVIVAGPRDIHNFPMSYDFCSHCETRSCRQRLRALYGRGHDNTLE